MKYYAQLCMHELCFALSFFKICCRKSSGCCLFDTATNIFLPQKTAKFFQFFYRCAKYLRAKVLSKCHAILKKGKIDHPVRWREIQNKCSVIFYLTCPLSPSVSRLTSQFSKFSLGNGQYTWFNSPWSPSVQKKSGRSAY